MHLNVLKRKGFTHAQPWSKPSVCTVFKAKFLGSLLELVDRASQRLELDPIATLCLGILQSH